MKISIIGVGRVGSLVGFILGRRGLANEIVLCSRDEDTSRRKAAAEALDISHAIAFTSHRLIVRSGVLEDTANSDILVMAASCPMPADLDDRMNLVQANTDLMRKLVPKLVDISPDAVIVNVTNPLDVITHHILRLSGFNWRKVIGTGTLIDSARYRRKLSDTLDINAVDINAYVLGEHGETQFAAVSHASTGGEKLTKLLDAKQVQLDLVADVEAETRRIGWEIFSARGYTNYAVAMAVEMIVDNIVHNLCSTLPVSVQIDGFCDQQGLCLSIPCVIGRRGIRQRLEPELDREERKLFVDSAKRVRSIIKQTSKTDPPPSTKKKE